MTAAALTDGRLQASDGVTLPLRSWLPIGSPKAVVVALHGMNDYSNAFDAPGKALAAKGIATYAYDQRGFGVGPHPGYWSSTKAMADDLNACATLLHQRHPGIPLYVLGESMGGAVVIIAAQAPSAAISGLILAAPAVWGRSTMGWLQQGALWLTNAIAPGWTLTGRGLGIQASDNIEMLRALSRDPLVIKETRVDAIHGLVDLMDAAQMGMAAVQLPVLVLYGEKDEVIPPKPTWAAIRRLPRLGEARRVALYENGWHMLLRDLQAQVVVDDIVAWMADASAPLPSRADMKAQGKLEQ
ncbi:alpha/beta hydrolase [Paramagnetospirillum kuznetsovii]|uniref:alpha/beta hydrolase n=1 Tax=Paramagnetospirillum kuznetsovii TaxID=2053833 RepID=UPI001EFCCBF2|nr:alpha/beta hydrolase [Paramagnetospirillum kuznetsovii]